MHEKEDAELVAQARRDDPDAFRVLIERYQMHEAVFVLFGLILFGKGQIWLANVELEVVKQKDKGSRR